MKILFISDVYFPRVNGVSTSIKTFAGQLALLGHQVDLIAPNYGAAGDLNVKGKSIMRVSARSIFFDPEDKLMKYTEALTLLPNLQAAEYDLIHINTPFIAHFLGLKFAKILNIPCIETYHTFFEDYLHHYCPWFPKSIARSIARIVSKRQCNAVDAIVSPSQPMLDVLRTYGVTAQAEVIPTGMLPASFANADTELFKEKYGIDKDRSTLLYVGRVAFEKNITFLLEMTKILIKKHSNVLLVIAGEGPAKAYLHQLSEKLNLGKNVRFIGYLDRNSELNACYKSADIFVFASKSETQGLVLLEAMAQSTPVVAIAELGTASILIEGEGAMIAPDAVDDFSEKVAYLIENPLLRKSLGQRAKQYVSSRWTTDTQAKRMVQFYQRIINNN